MKKLLMAATAMSVMGFAGSAMAGGPIDAANYVVDVNIQVDEVVSMWSNQDNINLVMDGMDANNLAVARAVFDHSGSYPHDLK